MEESLDERSQEDQSTQESVSAPVREKRWNLRERPPPVQRLDSSIGQEPEAPSTSRKRKAAAEARAPAPKRKAQKSPVQPVQRGASDEEEEGGMFAAVLGGRSALQAVASEWVDRYQEGSETAMAELIQFFIHCCGCRATITMEMFQNEDTTSIIRSLTENFDEESGDYPLIAGGAAFKKFEVFLVCACICWVY